MFSSSNTWCIRHSVDLRLCLLAFTPSFLLLFSTSDRHILNRYHRQLHYQSITHATLWRPLIVLLMYLSYSSSRSSKLCRELRFLMIAERHRHVKHKAHAHSLHIANTWRWERGVNYAGGECFAPLCFEWAKPRQGVRKFQHSWMPSDFIGIRLHTHVEWSTFVFGDRNTFLANLGIQYF